MPSARVVVAGVGPPVSRDRRDAAEDPADRSRVEAARVELPEAAMPTRHHDLVPADDRGQDVAPDAPAARPAASAAGR